MEQYIINHMIIDDDFMDEESVTANFIHNHKEYKITFTKSDLEIINTWLFEGETTIPTILSDSIIESIREEVKNKI
ncbi:hypothetical protein ACOI1C_20105 [Bacillus sp. DJP31]|uniref:hypothetical protein n=1 Tax=Bacillus sp. DJP31 TaxID=3409789 RepID=UPI003BB661B0